MNKIQVLSKQTLRDLGEVRRRVLGTSPPQGPQETGTLRQRWYWARLTANLDAPTDGMTGATTAGFDIWVPDGTNSTPEKYVVATNPALLGQVVTNRWTGLSAASGTLIQVERDGREWTLKGADC